MSRRQWRPFALCRMSLCVGLSVAACSSEVTVEPGAFEREAQAAGDAGSTKIGVFYLLWHCGSTNPVYTTTAANGPWGAFHWWGQPQLGYYCLSHDTSVLRQHAIWLRDAGVDFVFIDSTNHPRTDTNGAQAQTMIVDPFNRLLEEWSQVPGAPRVVPWAPLTARSNMLQYLLQRLSQYPQLAFQLDGKQLALVVEHGDSPIDPTLFAELQIQNTLRVMWALYGQPGPQWSFLQPCAAGFKASGGTIACNQRIALNGGAVEQVSITAAYQETYMSNTATAVPKLNGKTLRQQFQTLFDHPEAPVATITGWNEWIAQRFCQDGGTGCAPAASVFVDAWDDEYNRDIEPGGAAGDYYYRLMTSCIAELKRGSRCNGSASANALCCKVAPGSGAPGAGVTGQSPVGWLDGLAGGVATGWACDQDDPTAQIGVHLYVGGPAGSGAMGYQTVANQASEPAVNATCGGGSAHRFSFTIPGWEALGGQAVYAYGIDVGGDGNRELSGSPMVMPASSSVSPSSTLPIRFLGTCAPNSYCWENAGRQLASVLVGADMVIDFSCWNSDGNSGVCGVARLRQYGIDVNDVSYVLITHNHEDHFDPAEVVRLARARTAGTRLTVLGGYDVVSSLNAYLAANDAVDLLTVRQLTPSTENVVGPYLVTPIVANHPDPGVLTDPFVYLVDYNGKRFLYGLDSGRFSGPGRRVDLVIREGTFAFDSSNCSGGHMCFAANRAERDAWIAQGLMAADTPYIITHVVTWSSLGCSGRCDAGPGLTVALDNDVVTLGGAPWSPPPPTSGGSTSPPTTSAGPSVPATDNYLPVGSFDGVQNGVATGWACDRDDPAAQVAVHIYVGGSAGSGAPGYPFRADQGSEAAVSDICGGGDAHRFFFTIPNWTTLLGQPVFAYGINLTPGGGNTCLTGSPATVR